MASPAEITCKNLTGKFVINKTLSDDLDRVLALQGLSWLTRKAISIATVVLTIKEYQDEPSGTYHIDITSNASGLSTTQENRTLDWQDRDHADRIFGKCRGRSLLGSNGIESFEPVEIYSPGDIDFLKGKHLKDGKTPSAFLDEIFVHSYVKNQDQGYGWTAEQVWSFEEIAGKRYYARRVVVRNAKGDQVEKVRLVYDYKGSLEAERARGAVEEEEDDGLAYGDES